METGTNIAENQKLIIAQNQVRKIRGFYIHILVYVVTNLMLIAMEIYDSPQNWLRPETFATAFFWGIGLASHAFSVFIPNFIFGKNWEERQIQKYLKK